MVVARGQHRICVEQSVRVKHLRKQLSRCVFVSCATKDQENLFAFTRKEHPCHFIVLIKTCVGFFMLFKQPKPCLNNKQAAAFSTRFSTGALRIGDAVARDNLVHFFGINYLVGAKTVTALEFTFIKVCHRCWPDVEMRTHINALVR